MTSVLNSIYQNLGKCTVSTAVAVIGTGLYNMSTKSPGFFQNIKNPFSVFLPKEIKYAAALGAATTAALIFYKEKVVNEHANENFSFREIKDSKSKTTDIFRYLGGAAIVGTLLTMLPLKHLNMAQKTAVVALSMLGYEALALKEFRSEEATGTTTAVVN